jgi:two-component system chemotaxis sensor kinase CheA
MSDHTIKKTHEDLLGSLNTYFSKEKTSDHTSENGSDSCVEKGNKKFSTWHILLYATESILLRGVKLMNIFKDLVTYGQFQINRVDNHSAEESDDWSILLYTNASEEELRNVFLFIEDDCTLVRVSDKNLLVTDSSHQQKEASDEYVSILEYVEGVGKTNETNIKPNTEIVQHQEKHLLKRISVDASKLDQLMFLVSELITVNSQLNISTHSDVYNPIKPYLEKVDSLAKQFRNNAIEIRLVPLSDTVLRFQRLIRDLSRHLNKKIRFNTYGTNTELDKNTIDQLAEPLMHIIRNCIDHGIEDPAIRVQQGKPEEGVINLEAFNSGNNVIISVSDDGCGIDDEKVRLKAVDNGYIKPGDFPDKKRLYDFIFLPGFSTAQNLTEVSGRGVGMDVVKQRITELRGEIAIDSEKGIGTTFTLKLQQSLSIVDSLLFRVDNNYFTVPVTDIAVCDQLETRVVTNQKNTATLPFNNHLIPFIDLRFMFCIGGEYPQRLKSIIIRNNEKEMALLCDKIIGEHQAVLKPLGKSFRDQKYITAASQMGDGHMAFMLDTNALFKLTEV